MADNRITGSVGLDISDFKANVTQLNRQIELVRTGFQAAGDGTAEFGKSQEGLQAKIKALTETTELQRKKIENLDTQRKKVIATEGENSKAAENLTIKINKETAALNSQTVELKTTQTELEYYGKSSEKAGVKLDKLGGILKGVGVAMGAVAAATAAAAIKLAKDVVKQFGELEQNLGGSEAVFGEYAQSIQQTGEEAYRNLGVSQSQYLATANKMGALFQGSGIEQQKSLELTEKAMQRAADMASVMGIDMQQALDSVAGAAKGNFTMMDNLGVAMNATNIEAYALAKGLEFTWETATQAEKAEMAMQMFFDSTEQYAGNFAKESTQTITGSLGLLKASISSFTAGLGNANADMANLTGNMIDAFQSVVKNVVPVLANITNALPEATSGVLESIGEFLPDLLETVTEIFEEVLETLLKLFPSLMPVMATAIKTISNAIVRNIPLLASAAISLVKYLAVAITENIGSLTTAAVELVIYLVKSIAENIGLLANSAIDIVLALVNGIIDSLPMLIQELPVIMEAVIMGIMSAIPQLLDAAVQIILSLAEFLTQPENIVMLTLLGIDMLVAIINGVVSAIPQLLGSIGDIITAIFRAFKEIDWLDLGKNIIFGIIDGVKSAATSLASAVVQAAKDALQKVKDFLGIKSPSRLFADEVGFQIGAGEAVGIEQSKGKILSAVRNLNKDIAFNPINVGVGSAGITNTPVNSNMGGTVINYNQYNTSPKEINAFDTYRYGQKTVRELKLQLGGVR